MRDYGSGVATERANYEIGLANYRIFSIPKGLLEVSSERKSFDLSPTQFPYDVEGDLWRWSEIVALGIQRTGL